MDNYLYLVNDLSYIWMIIFIMISAGVAKDKDLFAPAYAYVKDTFKSNKVVVVLLSSIGGILPIEGRVTVSAGLLDTVAPKCGHGREKMGIVDYLATHHYYMWSPLEKTVLIPIAAFGLTYAAWFKMVWPLILVSFVFIGWYVWTQVDEDEVIIQPAPLKISALVRNVVPMFLAIGVYIYQDDTMIYVFGGLAFYYLLITQQWDPKKIWAYINWEVIFTVVFVIILGNFIKHNSEYFEAIVKTVDPKTAYGMIIISLMGFAFSVLMGSSGKFVALAVLMAKIFGIKYFLWFFAVDYAGYLLSPTHKCVMVGNRYFGTPYITYYKALGTWSVLLLTTAGLLTYYG